MMYLKLPILLLMFLLFDEGALETNNTTGPISPVLSRAIPSRRFSSTINSAVSHVWFLKLGEVNVDDIFRIRCSILRPATKRKFGLHYLQVSVTNGRDGVSFSLPETTRSGIVVNETTRLLNPIKLTDIRNYDMMDQYLTIHISTRATVDFVYEILYDRIDQNQYIVKLKDDKTLDLNHQKFGFQRPLGFQFQNNNADVLRISVKSDDELCGIFVMTSNEGSIYEYTGEISTSDRTLRVISFTKRMDIMLLKEQIPQNLYMYYIGQPDDNICYENAVSRKNLAVNKNISIHYSTEEEVSYFLPVSFFLLLFLGGPPALLVVYGYRIVQLEKLQSSEVVDAESVNSTTFQNNSFNQDNASHDSSASRESNESRNPPIYYTPLATEDPTMHRDWKLYDVQLVLFILPVLMMNGFHIYRIIHNSNMDERCFHNFACAKPLGFFVSFNHMISNCGYFVNGLWYLLFVRVRRNRNTAATGVKNNYLLEICLGLSILCEAMGSAFYHVCPGKDLYHFDTPFIQVFCVLVMLKLYGNRRAVISPSVAYHHISAILTLDVIVTVLDPHKYLRAILVFIQFSVIFYVFYMVASYNDGIVKFLGWLRHTPSTVVVVAVNLASSGCLLYIHDYIEVDQFVTFLCVVNMIVYLIYYSLTKLHRKEKLSNLTKLMLLGSMALWCLALYYYEQDETSWALTPAQSRALNKECVLLNFYDRHDIWHLISAEAILATLIAVSTLDDPQASQPFDELETF